MDMSGSSIPKSYDEFKKKFNLEIVNLESSDSIPFKCIFKKVPPIFHQSIRKVILNDVPSIAIDRIYGYDFGDFLNVEDIIKLIGLVPIDVNPDKLLDYGDALPSEDELSIFKPDCSLYFKLDVFSNSSKRFVHSKDLKWVPLENQSELFSSSDIHINDKILINILTSNEHVLLNCLAVKGYGWDHAKFKPASCALPKPKPVLKINQIKNNDAKLFKSLFSEGVIKIVKNEAVVDNIWKLERVQKIASNYPQFNGKFQFSYDESEYIWIIESIRPINQPAHDVFLKAIDIILEKCQHYTDCLQKLKNFFEISKSKYESPRKLISGKTRYITIQDMDVAPESPDMLFHNEDDSITQSLMFIVRTMYKSSVMCSDMVSNSDVLVRCEVIPKNSKLKSCEMLIEGFKELTKFYTHIQTVFKKKLEEFVSNQDVEME